VKALGEALAVQEAASRRKNTAKGPMEISCQREGYYPSVSASEKTPAGSKEHVAKRVRAKERKDASGISLGVLSGVRGFKTGVGLQRVRCGGGVPTESGFYKCLGEEAEGAFRSCKGRGMR